VIAATLNGSGLHKLGAAEREYVANWAKVLEAYHYVRRLASAHLPDDTRV
jgi:hypothetical protein